jgi:hypothetical protein
VTVTESVSYCWTLTIKPLQGAGELMKQAGMFCFISGPLIQKVIDATAIAKKKRPDLQIEGPLQVFLELVHTYKIPKNN